jgi:hypothetical protein
MKHAAWSLISILIWVAPVQAQSAESNSFSRLNSNAALMVSAPLSSMGTYTTIAWGFEYGAGYNFSRHHSVVGEIMWNSLYPTSAALAPIRAALQTNDVHGHGNLVALTANYRLQFEGKTFGTYFIAGAGLYYRNANLSQLVAAGNSISCDPAWLWWGFSCESGTVTGHQTLGSSSTTAPGGNIGVGFTVKIPDSRYKFYIETRYHYAASQGVPTRILPIGLGVRF